MGLPTSPRQAHAESPAALTPLSPCQRHLPIALLAVAAAARVAWALYATRGALQSGDQYSYARSWAWDGRSCPLSWCSLDSPIVFSANTGDTPCIDRSHDRAGGFGFADHDGCVDPNQAEVPRNAGNTRKAITFILRNPHTEVELIIKRAWVHLFVGIALISLVAVPPGLWGNPRFHVPALPFLALAAACGLMWLRGHAQAHSRGRNGPSRRYTTLSPDRSTSVALGSVSNHSSGGRSATTTPNRSSST